MHWNVVLAKRGFRATGLSTRQRRLLARFFAIAASLLSLMLYALHPPLLDRLDVLSRDLAFQMRSPPVPPDEVVIVAIDEKSVKHHGRWPWSRRQQARLIQYIKQAGAAAIALDIVYPQPQGIADDQRLLQVITTPGAPVVGGYFFREQLSLATADATLSAIRDQRIKIVRETEVANRKTVPEYPYIEANHPSLLNGFAGFGFFNVMPDPDGLIRTTPLVLRQGGHDYPALAIKALAIAFQLPLMLNYDLEGVAGLQLGTLPIPVDSRGRLALNFYSPQRPIQRYSATDVLDHNLGLSALKDKLVFVGVTELGIADVRPTPLDPSFPGVAVQATVAANVLQGFHLYRDNRTILIDVAVIALLPLVMVWLLSLQHHPLSMTLTFGATLALDWYLFYLALTHYQLVISLFYPVLATLIGFSVFLTYEILITSRRARFLRRAFSSYVSPALVGRIIQQPDALNLKGERRFVTILFSDIRSFTTLSEDMEPEAMVALLNRFLGPMTEILMSERGTLDKYIGDAIMAIFNAPLDDPKHARHGVLTAIQMIRRLQRMNPEFQRVFKRELKIGIGLNSGDAVVGNMGSPRRFNYTAMGDTVNLASRLEGRTKFYGVDIIMAKSTRDELAGKHLNRHLDCIRVKGKNLPVEIYQLFVDGKSEDNRTLAQVFEAALELYLKAEFSPALEAFRTVSADFPDDHPTQIYLDRCQYHIDHPPGDDWDGIYTMTDK